MIFKQINASPISVPVSWPDSGSSNYNGNNYNTRRPENIYNRPNAEFNRLTNNRIGHSYDAVDFNDFATSQSNEGITPPNDYQNPYRRTSTTTTTTTTRKPFNDFNSKYEGYDIENRRNHRRRRPYYSGLCIPIPLYQKALRSAPTVQGRTFWDLNLFLGPQAGYPQGGYPAQSPVQSDTNHQQVYNPIGGYGCVPLDTHNTVGGDTGHRPHRPFGNGGGLGSIGQNDNRPSGGPLGFFGQGGLFDISSYTTPPSTELLNDSVNDLIKPVVELNVQDTIQDVVSFN